MNIAPDGLGYMQDCNADREKKGAWVDFSQGYLPRHLLNVSTISFASQRAFLVCNVSLCLFSKSKITYVGCR